MKFTLSVEDLDGAVDRVKYVHGMYVHRFRTRTRSVARQSFHYLQGKLLEKGNGNMCSYAKDVPDCDNQSLQHFISSSPWDHRPVIDDIQRDVTRFIGDEENGALQVDECSFPKQGTHSVGVHRQHCGRLGKIANCQVGVFLGYTKGPYRTLIDERLYLPRAWADDENRRAECGVPEDIAFKKKTELAWEMILHAQRNGVPFGWVGMDSLYGRDTWLRRQIDDEGMVYVADIPCDLRVWRIRPQTGVPARKGDRGPVPSKERVMDGELRPVEVRTLMEQLDDEHWETVFIRDTERRELWAQMACLRVYPVVDGLPGDEVWLIIRKDVDKDRVKYQLCNASADTSLDRLATMSASRYWIERAFEDGKGIAGLADYQVRGWTGWHHHMTMTLLAMLLLLLLTLDMGEKAEFLTVQDVKEILEEILPKREVTDEELLSLILEKHKRRESARRSHHRRNQ